jgi:hypothetical protein
MKDKDLVMKTIDETQGNLELIMVNLYAFLPKEKQLVSSLKNAWEEIIPSFRKIKEQLNVIDTDLLLTLGLNNHQLILKYELFKKARGTFREKNQSTDMSNGKEKKAAKDDIIRMLDATHTILRSLEKTIPAISAVLSFNSVLKNILGR